MAKKKATDPIQKSAQKITDTVPIVWMVVIVTGIIIVLLVAAYLLFVNLQTGDKAQSPDSTEQPSAQQQDLAQDEFEITYSTVREITAHVIEYRIELYRDGTLFASLIHQSAPIERIDVSDNEGTTLLTVRAIDYIDGQSYQEIYKYALDGNGNFTLIE